MRTNVEHLSNLSKKITIQVPADSVRAAFERLYNQIQKDVTLKGFRKGKAPLQTIRNLYQGSVRQDVASELIRTSYTQALNEHQLNPVSYPDIEFDDPVETKEFSFTAQFEVRPDVVLKKIEGLEVEKKKLQFDEGRVDQVLQNIQKAHARTEELKISRSAQIGDVAKIDFEGFFDGAPLENGSGQDFDLELGSKSFIEGFEEGIVGMKVGDVKSLQLKFPDNYEVENLKGKEVEFVIRLKLLQEKILPELTEEFLKTIGGATSLEALRADIRKDLVASEEKKINEGFRNSLMKALVKANPVEVPSSLLVEQKSLLVSDFKKKMENQGMNESEFAEYSQRWNNDFEETAREMVQAQFLVDALAEQNQLFCTDEDFEKRLEKYANQTGIGIDRVRDYYSKANMENRLRYTITEEKVMEYLEKKAQIKFVESP